MMIASNLFFLRTVHQDLREPGLPLTAKLELQKSQIKLGAGQRTKRCKAVFRCLLQYTNIPNPNIPLAQIIKQPLLYSYMVQTSPCIRRSQLHTSLEFHLKIIVVINCSSCRGLILYSRS